MTDLKVNIINKLRAEGSLTSEQIAQALQEPQSAVIAALLGLVRDGSVQASGNPPLYSLPVIR